MRTKRPIRLEDLFALRAVGRVALSPDGRCAAFELKRADPDENGNFTQLLLVDVESGRTRPLTEAGRHSDTLPRWSPDGSRIAFISTREKSACLYVMPMSGGEPRRISDRDGNVRDHSWSPDGRRIAFVYQALSEREKLERDDKHDDVKKRPQFKRVTRLHHKLDGEGWWNGHYRHVWVVGAEGGKPRQLTRGDYDDDEPRWSPDGRWVSFVSNRLDDPDLNFENADIYVVRPGGGAVRKVTRKQGSCRSHTWSPDGLKIAFVGNPGRTGESWKFNEHVWVVDAGGGRPRNLTSRLDHHCVNLTLGDVTSANWTPVPPIWSRDARRVCFAVSENGATRLFSQSVAGRDLRCEIGGDVNIMFAQRTARDGPIALSIGNAASPGDVFIANPAHGFRLRQLTHVNADVLDRIDVGLPEPFSVRSGRVEVHGWVLKPPGFDPRRRYPAILQIHGGPHAQYGHAFFHEMQWLAAKGYVVCYANPRGSAGYGLKFMNCIHADWGNLDYQDVMRVADWLFARPYVDRKRVGVTGGSYGGYMTNWLIAHTNRFKAAVTQRSVVNIESMFGTSDYGYDLGSELGGTPWTGAETLRRQSPLTYVKSIRTPLLIEHEEEDHRCPIEQGEQLFTALRVLGRPVELVRFEGESHGLSRIGRPQNRAERLRRIAAWFDRYLR